ncbi:MAG: capsid staple protein [Pseudomonadota bacterium]
MKLVSMENTADDRRAARGGIDILLGGADDDAPDYPDGLLLRIDGDQLARLALDDPEVGNTVRIEGLAEIVGYREDQRGEDTERCLELQITALAVEPDPDAAKQRREDDRLNALSGAAAAAG